MEIDENVGIAYDFSFIIYLSLEKEMGEKWKRLMHRYVMPIKREVAKIGFSVYSIDFMQKFGD